MSSRGGASPLLLMPPTLCLLWFTLRYHQHRLVRYTLPLYAQRRYESSGCRMIDICREEPSFYQFVIPNTTKIRAKVTKPMKKENVMDSFPHHSDVYQDEWGNVLGKGVNAAQGQEQVLNQDDLKNWLQGINLLAEQSKKMLIQERFQAVSEEMQSSTAVNICPSVADDALAKTAVKYLLPLSFHYPKGNALPRFVASQCFLSLIVPRLGLKSLTRLVCGGSVPETLYSVEWKQDQQASQQLLTEEQGPFLAEYEGLKEENDDFEEHEDPAFLPPFIDMQEPKSPLVPISEAWHSLIQLVHQLTCGVYTIPVHVAVFHRAKLADDYSSMHALAMIRSSMHLPILEARHWITLLISMARFRLPFEKLLPVYERVKEAFEREWKQLEVTKSFGDEDHFQLRKRNDSVLSNHIIHLKTVMRVACSLMIRNAVLMNIQKNNHLKGDLNEFFRILEKGETENMNASTASAPCHDQSELEYLTCHSLTSFSRALQLPESICRPLRDALMADTTLTRVAMFSLIQFCIQRGQLFMAKRFMFLSSSDISTPLHKLFKESLRARVNYGLVQLLLFRYDLAAREILSEAKQRMIGLQGTKLIGSLLIYYFKEGVQGVRGESVRLMKKYFSVDCSVKLDIQQSMGSNCPNYVHQLIWFHWQPCIVHRFLNCLTFAKTERHAKDVVQLWLYFCAYHANRLRVGMGSESLLFDLPLNPTLPIQTPLAQTLSQFQSKRPLPVPLLSFVHAVELDPRSELLLSPLFMKSLFMLLAQCYPENDAMARVIECCVDLLEKAIKKMGFQELDETEQQNRVFNTNPRNQRDVSNLGNNRQAFIPALVAVMDADSSSASLHDDEMSPSDDTVFDIVPMNQLYTSVFHRMHSAHSNYLWISCARLTNMVGRDALRRHSGDALQCSRLLQATTKMWFLAERVTGGAVSHLNS